MKFKPGDRVFFPQYPELGSGSIMYERKERFCEINGTAYYVCLDNHPNGHQWEYDSLMEFEALKDSPLWKALE